MENNGYSASGFQMPKNIYRYRSSKRMVQELSTDNHYIWLSSFTDLNDPMEGIYNLNDSPNMEDFTNFKEAIYFNKMSLGIVCFSERFDIFPMWTHYAENGQGYCVEYNTNELLRQLRSIVYAGKIEYVKSLHSMDIKTDVHETHYDFKSSAIKILSKKYDQWSYEKEIRILTQTGEYYTNPKSQLVELNNSVINRVILGENFDKRRGFSFMSNSSRKPELNISKKVYQLKRQGSALTLRHCPLT